MQQRAGDTVQAADLAERVSEDDDGALAELRRGRGAVTLETVPPGARVIAQRFDDGLPRGGVETVDLRGSHVGRAQPFAVGAFRDDVSVYGVRDLAGGVRDWCGDRGYGGDTSLRPVRGGSWDSEEVYCRLTHRTCYLPGYVCSSFGFRLVWEIEGA